MSKHVRVPSPAPKILPSIIRSSGARIFLVVGACAAVVVVSGGGYLLSRSTVVPRANQPAAQTAEAHAKVLGTSTTQPQNTPTQASAPSDSAASAASATTPSPAASTAASPHVAAKAAVVAPSFTIGIDTSKIQRAGLLVNVPFTIERHGGLSGVIQPGNVSITAGGLLTDLITIKSETMLTPDSGLIVLLPVGLGHSAINGHFSASCGSVMASTNFSYQL